MGIVELCVKRPVLTIMMMVTLLVLGLFAYLKLGVDLFPNVDFPFITVQTTLKGASPEEMETSVTKTIEESINTISGVEDITSTSYEGMSMIFVKFVLEKDVDTAAQDVRDKVNLIQKNLPQGTDPPVIGKLDVGAIPVVNIVVSGNKDLIELTRIAKKKIKENIETVNGVGSVELVGGREREIHIVVNPLKMASLNLSTKQVKDAVIQQNIEIPGGRVEQTEKEYGLRTLGRISSVKDFNDIVITSRNGAPIKISDIGRVEDTGEYQRTAGFLNGRPCVTAVVKKQSGTNTVEVVAKIKERLAALKGVLPPGVSAQVISDQSKFIKASVDTVKEHLILGALCAALMVLIFMGSLRPTVISALAIPTSVIGTFTFMQGAGFTLNNMTLLGLTIAVGIVIDDAIVMLENIYRHMEELKKPPLQAALDGAKEIGFAVIAMSLSLLVIFLPLAYMGGIIGRFIKSYGLTIAFAVAISTFVALTLTPMLCSIFLRVKHGNPTPLSIFTERLNNFLAEHYARALAWALEHKGRMVVFSLCLIISAAPMLKFIGKDFMPADDTSIYQISVKAPEGTSLEKMRKIFAQLETDSRKLPYVKNVLMSIGKSADGSLATNKGDIIIELADTAERPLAMSKIMSATRKLMAKYTSLKTSVTPTGGFGGKDADLYYVISGPELPQLQKYANGVAAELAKEKGVVDVDTSFSFAKPEYLVEIERSRAHDLGVKVEDIAMSLRTLVGGEEDITKYKDGDELYQVRIRADAPYRDRPEAISAMVVPTNQNGTVRLDSVATVRPGFGPTQIDRYNRQRQITISANLEGAPLNRIIQKADKAFKSLNPLPEYRNDLTGKTRELGRMLQSFAMAFALSFIFIYIVLASQFESFVYPVSIMTCLPLTIPFAVLSLFITNASLTLFSIMGMFMLVGIVKKNAILQVDYTNTLRARGYDRHKAIIEANKTRLRPILMTTLTLIAGMIPTAVGTGAGAGVRRTMAVVIIGGQALSLLITLLMTPVTYVLMDDLQNWFKAKFSHPKA